MHTHKQNKLCHTVIQMSVTECRLKMTSRQMIQRIGHAAKELVMSDMHRPLNFQCV